MHNEARLRNTPTFPDEVYRNLSPFISELTDQFDDPREKDLVLISILVMIGACLAEKVRGKYRGDWLYPNLYAFIIAPPASGKSRMKYPKLLGQEIQRHYTNQNRDAKEKYNVIRAEWEQQLKKSPTSPFPPPVEPNYPCLFIPGNASSASIYNLLLQSKGTGIICETEADTLTGAISAWWGDFSHLLRCSFQHEPLTKSRAQNNEYITIEYPKLSILLSGTPNQVANLIQSTEDGLFSRFLFYCYRRELVFLDITSGETTDLTKLFNERGKELLEAKNDLGGMIARFALSDEQVKLMTSFFNDKLSTVKTFEGAGAASVVFRMALIFFRIAMILTVITNIKKLAVRQITCSDVDFETTRKIINVLFEHSMVMYSLLPSQENGDLHSRVRQFYNSIPDDKKLERSELDQVGKSMDISERTVNNYINKLKQSGLLVSHSYGVYEKRSLHK